MRNFSLISILLALAIGAIVWQKLIVRSAPDRLPEPAEYTTTLDDQGQVEEVTEDCVEQNEGASECESDVEIAEQGEMVEQRSRAHDTMMKSFDKKYDKYKDQIKGQQ